MLDTGEETNPLHLGVFPDPNQFRYPDIDQNSGKLRFEL